MIRLVTGFKTLKGAKEVRGHPDKQLDDKQLLAIREKLASLLLDVISNKGSVEAAMSETGSSDSNAQLDQVLNLQPKVSAQIGACSTSQHRKPRAQTKWPSDITKVVGFDSEGFPTNDDGMKRWQLI